MSLYLEDTSGKARGGVIIVPGMASNPADPEIIDALRQVLARNHWHSLALSMPPLIPAAAGDTSAATGPESNEETAGEKLQQGSAAPSAEQPGATPTTSLDQQAILAAIHFLNQQGVFNLAIIREGTGAISAATYLRNMPPADSSRGEFPQLRALVMINARNSIGGKQDQLSALFPSLTVPVIDLYLGNDYRDKREVQQRQKAGQSLAGKQYLQIKMPPVGPNWQDREDRLTKRIRGWLDKRIAGFVIDTHVSSPRQ